MAPPTRYTRQFNFVNQQALTPAQPLPADKVDAELNALVVTTDQVITNLSLIQRDDGALANQSVGPDQLATSVSIGMDPPEVWASGQAYTLTSIVTYNNKFYVATSAHTSATGNRPDQGGAPWSVLVDFSTASVVDGSVSTAKIADGAVTAAKIADGSVTAVKLVDGAATSAKIADGAVTEAKLAADSVTADKIAAGAVGSSEIATDAVGSDEIAAGAVGTAELAANAVTVAKMAREGTAGHVLTSNGAGVDPSYKGNGGGVLLATGSDASVGSRVLPLTSGYSSYRLEILQVKPATDGAVLYLRFSTDGGSSYLNTSYVWAWGFASDLSTTPGASNSSSGATAVWLGGAQTNTNGWPAVGVVSIYPPALAADTVTQALFQYAYLNNSGNLVSVHGSGGRIADPPTHIQLIFSTGNIASLTYRLYGIL